MSYQVYVIIRMRSGRAMTLKIGHDIKNPRNRLKNGFESSEDQVVSGRLVLK